MHNRCTMFRTLLISMFLTSSVLADTWTVDDDGKADFNNIQAAVDAASNGDEIVVMPGTYTSSGSYVVNMNGKEVLLRSQEGPQSTIVSGQNQRTVFYCGNNETTSTIISGFTITQGSGSQGGGIRCEVSSPRIENCRIVDNYAGQGGGIACLGSNSDMGEIVNCVFKNNEAYFGGAIFGDMANLWVIDCLVRDNIANITGGIHVYCCSVALQNTTVCSNTNGQTYGTLENDDCLISETCESGCGDINGDNIVNVGDLLIIIKTWNTSDIDGDVTLDGFVDVEDILFIVAAWGNDCSPPQLAACCFGDMKWGWCEFITEEECNSAGGWYMGDGTDCGSTSCF
jgi:hypothetical protein